LTDRIRDIVSAHAHLPVDVGTLRDDDDLYEVGMTSHASVNLMLAVEDQFDVEFPDELLTRSAFQSIASIRASLRSIGVREDEAG
jgi:acyl carrier protein